MFSERLVQLIDLYFSNNITEVEKEELAHEVSQLEDEELQILLKNAWTNHQAQHDIPDEISQKIISFFSEQGIPVTDNKNVTPVIEIRQNKRWLKTSIAAACILAFVGGSLFLFKPKNVQPIVKNNPAPAKTIEDIKPGGPKALLILADGSKITLDSASSGVLAQQGNAQVIKLSNGEIKYTINGQTNVPALYNTITTPAGGIYQLILPDGTRAWLNSSSSIRYPTEFASEQRLVQISGEVYFEVVKNPSNPFIVKVNNLTEVKVLGTHFNVNAYDDEVEIKTTLLEGSVNITRGNSKCLLIPGQQAKISKNGVIRRIDHADLDEAVAWKNGYFLFNSAGLPDILRQAARWYNLDIVYESSIPPDKFSGQIPRSVNLSSFLKWMKWSDVHFKLDGEKLVIKP